MSDEKLNKNSVQSPTKIQNINPEEIHSLFASHLIDPKQFVLEPILHYWDDPTLKSCIASIEKHQILYALDHKSSVTRYFISYVKSNEHHSNQLDQFENPPEIFFWQNIDFNINENKDQLLSQIRTQFSGLVMPIYIFDLINKDNKTVFSEISRAQRFKFVFHYIGYDICKNHPEDLAFITIPKNQYESIQFKDLLEISCNYPPIYIIDRDNSGALLKIVNEFMKKSKDDNKPINDGCFFFSCSENELMPRSKDYPVDLFTTCLTSPAKIALIWHSRHYFCFQSGCLQTLPLFFFEELPQDEEQSKKIHSLLHDLKLALKSAVESMAFENMDPEMFVRMFRTDNTLSELSVNFLLACRILSFFDIHPVSYPELPDLNDCSQWQEFDLRLDATLYLLRSPNEDNSLLGYHHFLSQALDSMENLVQFSTSKNPPPAELSYFQQFLRNSELRSKACDVLSVYLDSSPEAVDYTLYFPILPTLFKILKNLINLKQTLQPSLIFSIIKLLCLFDQKMPFIDDSNKDIMDSLIPCLLKKDESSHLVAILLALLSRIVNLKPPKNLSQIKIAEFDVNTQVWLLIFVSYSAFRITDLTLIKQLLNQIEELSYVAKPELQIILICALSGFIHNPSNSSNFFSKEREKVERRVIEISRKFSQAASFLVRRELMLLYKKYKRANESKFTVPIESQDSLIKFICSYFEQCQKDPSDDVVKSTLNQDESFVFNTYIFLLLMRILPLKSKSLPILEFSSTPAPTQKIDKKNRATSKVLKSNVDRKQDSTQQLKLRPIYKHQSTISSNLLYLPNDEVIFGDDSGNVVIKKCNDGSIDSIIPLTNAMITDIQYLNNCNEPLIFAATCDGNCFVTSITETNKSTSTIIDNNITLYNKFEYSKKASFQLFPDVQEPVHMHHAIDQWNMRLYSYGYNASPCFKVRDLQSDRILDSLTPVEGVTNSLILLPKYNDIVATCGRTFDIFDLRASHDNPQLSLLDDIQYPPYYLQLFNSDIPIFALASNISSVTKLDMRYPTGGYTIKIIYQMQEMEIFPKSFSACKSQMVSAIGHKYGISFIDFGTFGQQAITQTPRTGIKISNTSAIAFHPDKYSLSFVNNNNFLFYGAA